MEGGRNREIEEMERVGGLKGREWERKKRRERERGTGKERWCTGNIREGGTSLGRRAVSKSIMFYCARLPLARLSVFL